jgi:hypothetical protein
VTDFHVGDHVIVVAEGPGRGATGVVRWSREGFSAINWTDEHPKEFGGAVVPNADLRQCDPDP